MSDVRKGLDPGSLVAGFVLIGLGLIFLLDRFDVADFGDLMRHYWPLILVFIGVAKLWRRKTIWSGLWLVTLGSWFQLVTLHRFGLTWGNSWPLVLVALGAQMILRAFVESLQTREEHHEP